MNDIGEMIERALRAEEPTIARDRFCEQAQLPRAKRRINATLARRLSLAGAACVGSLATLLLGAPVESLFAGYAEFGELATTLLEVVAIAGILVVPIAWLSFSE